MPVATRSTTVRLRRLSLGTLVKICYLACLGFCVCIFSILGLLTLLAPQSVKIDPDFTPVRFVVAMVMLIAVWPVIVGPLLGGSAWVALKIKSRFSQTEVEVIQDDKSPAG
jgi:cell shape-determining protein MreD